MELDEAPSFVPIVLFSQQPDVPASYSGLTICFSKHLGQSHKDYVTFF